MLKFCEVRPRQSQKLHLVPQINCARWSKCRVCVASGKLSLGFFSKVRQQPVAALQFIRIMLLSGSIGSLAGAQIPKMIQCFGRFLEAHSWLEIVGSEVVCVFCWIFLYFFWSSSCSCQRPLRHLQGCIETDDKGTWRCFLFEQWSGTYLCYAHSNHGVLSSTRTWYRSGSTTTTVATCIQNTRTQETTTTTTTLEDKVRGIGGIGGIGDSGHYGSDGKKKLTSSNKFLLHQAIDLEHFYARVNPGDLPLQLWHERWWLLLYATLQQLQLPVRFAPSSDDSDWPGHFDSSSNTWLNVG